MKKFGFQGLFIMAALLLFFMAVPAWGNGSPDKGGGGAITALDSAVDFGPVGIKTVYMKEGLFVGPPLLPDIVLAEKGKTLPSHRTGKGSIILAEYSRPPDLISRNAVKGIKTGHSGTVHIGSGAFMKRIGVRQHDIVLI